jgi:integrase
MLYALRTYPLLARHDLHWIPKLISQLPTDCEVKRRESKESRWVPYDVLAGLPDQIREDAETSRCYGEKARAIQARNELLIAWLTVLPWRQRNLRECKILPSSLGGNIFKEVLPPHCTIARPKWVNDALKRNPSEVFWQFWFRADETKTGFPVRGLLPRQLIRRLENYIHNYRPLLVDGTDPGTLFLNDHGRRFSMSYIGTLIEGLTFRYTGRRVNPHLFRDIFADKWLDDHPEDYLTVSKALWHRNIQTTLLIYGRTFDESHGARRVEEWLDKREADSSQEEMP